MIRFLSFFSSAGMDDDPMLYLFQWQHFLYVALGIISFFVILHLMKDKPKKTRDRFITILLVLMLLLKYGGEIIFVSEYYRFDELVSPHTHPLIDFQTIISFQLCGVNNVLLPIVIWFNIKPMKDFVYTTSIIGGLAVLLYPVGVLYGEPLVLTFVMIRTLIVHFLLIFIPLFLIITGEFTLEGKNWKNTLYGSLLMAAWSLFGNVVIYPGANYMYMMENPFYGGPIPLLNQLPNGYHLFLQIPILILGFVLVYQLIFFIQRHRFQPNMKKNQLG
ncbi:MAG: hypothetical protein AB7U79_03495 [Candidatus Izemoplasmatales bacterium]